MDEKDRTRVARSACDSHDYSVDCLHCRTRYFHLLIDETYTPNHVHEALKRENQMHKASAASYKVEAEGLRREVEFLRRVHETPGHSEGSYN